MHCKTGSPELVRMMQKTNRTEAAALRPSVMKLVLLWLVVGLPLAWGVYKTVQEIRIGLANGRQVLAPIVM
jgi:hypothetical protein